MGYQAMLDGEITPTDRGEFAEIGGLSLAKSSCGSPPMFDKGLSRVCRDKTRLNPALSA